MDYIEIYVKWTIMGLLIALMLILLFYDINKKNEKGVKKGYKNLFDHMNEGFALHEIICDEEGIPVDYRYLEVNKAFEEITGIKKEDILGRTVREVLPLTEDYWIKIYGEVALSGTPASYNNYSREIDKHVHVSVYSPKEGQFATLFTDISDIVDSGRKVEKERQLLITILESVMSGYWDRDLENGTAYYSPSYKAMFGYEDFELENKVDLWQDLIYEEDMEKSLETMRRHVESRGKIPFYFEARYRHKNGSIVNLIKTARVVEWNEDNSPRRIVGCNVNITRLKTLENQLREERNLFQTTLESIVDGVVTIDNEGVIQLINKSAETISGYSAEDAVGRNILDLLRLMDEKNQLEIILFREDFFMEESLSRDDLSLIGKNGDLVPLEYSISIIRYEEENIAGAVMVFRDISEKRTRMDKIAYLSCHDQLTGLYNRHYFEEQLMLKDNEENLPLTLCILDVNGLKMTNDAFGHQTGDKLLRLVAEEIKNNKRTRDLVFRVGGDEFVIMMPNTDQHMAKEVCKNFYRVFEKVTFENMEVSVSIGWETRNSMLENYDDVFKKAEEYMYRKKITEGQSMRSRTVQVILDTLNEKNKRERIHAQNVSKICRKIGQIMKFEPEVVKEIEMAGLLHDIGKIAVSDSILNKKGFLTDAEYDQIKRHPECGYQIMRSVDAYTKLADYILSHHERWDGNGYPRGLKGDSIPLISRIINIADSYEAMTSNRPYRKGMSHEEALKELKDHSGTQFDPYIVATFREHCLKDEW